MQIRDDESAKSELYKQELEAELDRSLRYSLTALVLSCFCCAPAGVVVGLIAYRRTRNLWQEIDEAGLGDRLRDRFHGAFLPAIVALVLAVTFQGYLVARFLVREAQLNGTRRTDHEMNEKLERMLRDARRPAKTDE